MQEHDDIRSSIQCTLQALFDVASVVEVLFILVDFYSEFLANLNRSILGAVIIEDDVVHNVLGYVIHGFFERLLRVIARHGDGNSFVLDHGNAWIADGCSSLPGDSFERRTMESSRQKRKVCIAGALRTGQDERQSWVFMKTFNKFIRIDAVWVLFPLVLMLTSCETMNLPSLQSKEAAAIEIKEAPIYVVMADRAPFYQEKAPRGKRASKGHPFLYLPKGTLVKVLKNKVPYSDVLLTNGMKGWMPISALAPQMAPADGPASSVVPVTEGSRSAGDGTTPLPTRLNPESGVKLPTY